MTASPPVVLVLAGLDPSGGAGLAADLQTLNALGCHAAPVATALTVQDTLNARRVDALPADLLLEQARAVIQDTAAGAQHQIQHHRNIQSIVPNQIDNAR